MEIPLQKIKKMGNQVKKGEGGNLSGMRSVTKKKSCEPDGGVGGIVI